MNNALRRIKDLKLFLFLKNSCDLSSYIRDIITVVIARDEKHLKTLIGFIQEFISMYIDYF